MFIIKVINNINILIYTKPHMFNLMVVIYLIVLFVPLLNQILILFRPFPQPILFDNCIVRTVIHIPFIISMISMILVKYALQKDVETCFFIYFPIYIILYYIQDLVINTISQLTRSATTTITLRFNGKQVYQIVF